MNSPFELDAHFNRSLEFFEDGLKAYCSQWNVGLHPACLELKSSIEYSLCGEGKRFRPLIAIFLAEAFGVPPSKVLAWAIAVEMIHTYSLIHDDLPCMDNDDFRRGKPTNHKVFGEEVALLSGDALLTESFGCLARGYASQPELAIRLVELLSTAAGASALIAGQAMDLMDGAKSAQPTSHLVHDLKTGALIAVALTGAARVCGLPDSVCREVEIFGKNLGLAFQIRDDILDGDHGFQHAEWLNSATQKAVDALARIGITKGPLLALAKWNSERSK